MLVSGDGSLLQSLLDATTRPGYPAEVVGVVSDRPAVRALQRAVLAGVPTSVVRPGDHHDRVAWDAALTEVTATHRPDLVVLAGFDRLVGPGFLARFGGRVLNSHPALLPAFPGLHAARDAIAHGVKVTGATLFVVDAGIDTGPIVAQVPVPVAEDDTEATLHERIKQAERVMLPDQVGRLAGSGFFIDGRKVVIG